MRVERLVEERLEVGLPAERPDGPQALQGDDEVGEDGTPSCGGGGGHRGQSCLRRRLQKTTTTKKPEQSRLLASSVLFFPEVAPEQHQDGGGGNPSAASRSDPDVRKELAAERARIQCRG